jgi:NCS1 family nucleobase:cation symporter-1
VGLAAVSGDRTDAWPLLPSERTWGAWRLGIVLATTAAATWCYVIGEAAGAYLGLRPGFAALTAGSMIGMAITALAVLPTAMRFGVDSIASCKPQFGSRGWALPLALQYVSVFGWNALLLIFFGKTVAQLAHAFGLADAGLPITPAVTAAACAFIWLVLRRGSSGIDRLSRVLVAHVFVGFWLIWVLMSREGDKLAAAVPASADPDRLWNYTTGVEIGLVSLLSWWPTIGAMVRLAPDARTAVLPVMLGMGAPVPLLSVIGLAGLLALGTSDPTLWLLQVGGPVYGVIGLLFVAAANLGTAAAGVYASALGLRHVRVIERFGWNGALLASALPVVVAGLAAPDWFFDHFNVFLALIGVMFAPICGIQIADYFLLRRGEVDLAAMYDPSPSGAYFYWAGVNPAAFAAMAAGCATYCWLLDPWSYASHAPYRYLTASLPACAVAGAVHAAVTLLVVQPAGRGGYPARMSAEPRSTAP